MKIDGLLCDTRCLTRYEKGLSLDFLRSFKEKTERKHGNMKGIAQKIYEPLDLYVPESKKCSGISKMLGISSEDFFDTALMAEACKQTGLSDWGDESFREPLKELLYSYEKDAKLNTVGRLATQKVLFDCLCNRLLIRDELTLQRNLY